MEKIYLIVLSGLFSLVLGMLLYWFREFRQILKELTNYTHELKQLIVGIQTQITKGLEADIVEIKSDIKSLYSKSNKNENSISSLKEKVDKK